MVRTHVDHLAAQLARIIEDGVTTGDFAATDPTVAGLAVLQARAVFHHQAHADEWAQPGLDNALGAVLDLLLVGLRPRG